LTITVVAILPGHDICTSCQNRCIISCGGRLPSKQEKLVLQRDKLIEKIKKYSNILRKEARIFAFVKPPLLLLLLKKQHDICYVAGTVLASGI
jgi:hypothetical protein